MFPPVKPSSDRRHARPRTLGLAVLCACLTVAVALPSGGDASPAKRLGNTKHTPNPACPTDTLADPCEAIGSVTGYQLKADGKNMLFKAPQNGKLVAWALDLSRPNSDQRNFFGEFFESPSLGTDPYARIAVIKAVEGRLKYKLLRQGPKLNLSDSLGMMQYVTLGHPLRIREGQILAVTVQTWGPFFANGLSQENQWRSSRQSGSCGPADAQASRPHKKVGTIRTYGCDYSGARLLYWGYYIPT